MTPLYLLLPSTLLVALSLFHLALTATLPINITTTRKEWPVKPGGKVTFIDRNNHYDVHLDGVDATKVETDWIIERLEEWEGRLIECIKKQTLEPVTAKWFRETMPEQEGKIHQVVMELLLPDHVEDTLGCVFLYDRFHFIDEMVIWKYGAADLEILYRNMNDKSEGKLPSLALTIHVIANEGDAPSNLIIN